VNEIIQFYTAEHLFSTRGGGTNFMVRPGPDPGVLSASGLINYATALSVTIQHCNAFKMEMQNAPALVAILSQIFS